MSLFNEFDDLFEDGSAKQEKDYTHKTGYALLNDRRAINDVRNYYASKGKTFANNQEMWDQFYSDKRWADVNTVSMIKDVGEYAFAGEDKKLHARLSKLWQNAPSRGTVWDKVVDYGTAGILDPTNLLGGWGVAAKGKKAYDLARAGGATLAAARKKALSAGTWQGAKTEAAIGGAIGTSFDAAQQGMEIAQGVSDEFDVTRAIVSGGLDAGLSALGGAAVGRYVASGTVNDLTNWRANSTFGTTSSQRISELDREINSISADYDVATDGFARADLEDQRANVEAERSALLGEMEKVNELDQELDSIAKQMQATLKENPQADVSDLKNKFTDLAKTRSELLEKDISAADLKGLSGFKTPTPSARPTSVEADEGGVTDTKAPSGKKATSGTKKAEVKEENVETSVDEQINAKRKEADDLGKIVEGQADTTSITKEAQDLLNSLEGGVLGSLNENVKRILRANGIDVTPTTTPEEAISSLKAKANQSVKPKAKASKVELTPEETAILDQIEGVDPSEVQVKFKEAGKDNKSGRTLGKEVEADIEKGLITEDQVKKLFSIKDFVNASGFPNRKWNKARKLIVAANRKLKGDAPTTSKVETKSAVKAVEPSTVKKAITPQQKKYKASQRKAYLKKRKELIGDGSHRGLSNAWSTAKSKQEVDDVINKMEDYINGKETPAIVQENAADAQADAINDVAKLDNTSFEAQEIKQAEDFFNKYWDESAGGAVNRGSYVTTRLADGVKKGNISGRVATIVRKMVKEAEEQVELGKKLESKMTYEGLRAEALARGLGDAQPDIIGEAKTYNLGKGATVTTEARDRTGNRIARNTLKASSELEEGAKTAGRTTVEYTRSDGTKVQFTKLQSIIRGGFNVKMLDPEDVRTVLGINDIPTEAKFNIDAAKARAAMDKDGGAVEGWADGQKLAYPFTATGVERIRGIPREPGSRKLGKAEKGQTYYYVPKLRGNYADPYIIMQSLGLDKNFNVKQRGLYNGKLESATDVIKAKEQVEKDFKGDQDKISAAKKEIDLKAGVNKEPEPTSVEEVYPTSNIPMSKEGKVLVAIPREIGSDAVRVASVKPGRLDGVAQADRPGMSASDLLGKFKNNPSRFYLGYVSRSLVEDEATLRALKADGNREKLFEVFEPIDEVNAPEGTVKPEVQETNSANVAPYEIGTHGMFDTTKLTTDQENAFVFAFKTMSNPKKTKAEIEKMFFGDGENKPTIGKCLVEDLWRWTEMLKKSNWRASTNGVNVPLGQRVTLLRELHGILADVAPGGIKKSNVDIEESVRGLRDVFSRSSAEELADMERVLRLTTKNAGVAPRITEFSDEQLAMDDITRVVKGATTSGKYRSFEHSILVDGKAQLKDRYNHLAFSPGGTSPTAELRPSFAFAHELGHWVFHNLLDPSDIQKYFKAVGRHVDETGSLTSEGSDFLFSKAPTIRQGEKNIAGANNWNASPGEHFANQFALYLHHHHDLMIVPDRTLWEKVTRIVRSLWEKMTNKNIIDKELEPIFQKIITNKDEFEIQKFHLPAREVTTAGGRTYQSRYVQWLESYRGLKLAVEDDNPAGIIAYADELANAINGSTATDRQAMMAARAKQRAAINEGRDPETEAFRGYTGRLRVFNDNKNLTDKLRSDYRKLKEMVAQGTVTEFLPGEDMATTSHNPEVIEELKAFLRSEEFDSNIQGAMDLFNEQFLYLEGADIPEYIPSQQLINLRKEKSIGSQRRTIRKKKYHQSIKAARTKRLKETIAKMRAIGGYHSRISDNQRKGNYSPQEVDLVTALSEYPKYLDEAGVPNKFGKQLASRVKHLIATKIEPIDKSVGDPLSNRQYTELDQNQLIFRYANALNRGDQGIADQVMYELQQRRFYKNNSQIIPTTSDRVNNAIDDELMVVYENSEEIGIPSSASFKVRNLLGKITNRGDELTLSSRTVAHRLMLLGAEFNPQTTSKSFNDFRTDVRRIGVNLTKKEDISQSVEMIARRVLTSSAFGEEKMASIRRAAAEFGFEPEDTIAKLAVDDLDASSDKATLKQLTKDIGESFDSTLEEALTSIRSEMREAISYVMNGLISKKGARKRFHNATVYGDMLGTRSGFDPSSPSLHFMDDIPSEYARDYASDLLRTLKPSTVRGIKSFTQTDDMTPYFVESLEGDNLFGNGINVTTSPNNNIKNSKDTILATIPDNFKEYGEELLDDLINLRDGIKSMRAFYRAEPTDIALQYDKEKAILDDLKRIGATNLPTSRVVFIKDNNPIDMNKRMAGKDPSIVAVMDAIASNTTRAIDKDLIGTFTPEEAYSIFVERAGSGMKLKEALKKAGYTSLSVGNKKSMIDPLNIKDIRSRDFVDEKFNMGVVPAPSDPVPYLIKAMSTDNDVGTDAFIQVASAAEQSGIPSKVVNVLDKVRRKKNITSAEGAEIRKASKWSLTKTNAQVMRQNGMHHSANFYEPSNGDAGHFERVNARMGNFILPLTRMLKTLPDSPTALGRWLNDGLIQMYDAVRGRETGTRASQLNRDGEILVNSDGNRRSMQPMSNLRIVTALRNNAKVNSLKTDEKKVYDYIRSYLDNAMVRMKESGMEVGHIRENYFPQIWRKDLIEKNYDQFVRMMTRYFQAETELTSNRTKILGQDDARKIAERVANKLIDNDGVMPDSKHFADPNKMSVTGKDDHTDFQRLIRLDQGGLKAFVDPLRPNDNLGQFLENDLMVAMTKYSDNLEHRLDITNKFGVGGFGFYDYLAVHDGKQDAISRLLSGDKVLKKNYKNFLNLTKGVEEAPEAVVATFSADIFKAPFPNKEASHTLVNELVSDAQKGASVSQLKHKIMNSLNLQNEPSLSAKKMHKNFQYRAEAIANALHETKGFQTEMSRDDLAFADGMMNATIRKPIDGSNGLYNLKTASKHLRSFNAVTLLGFTTLTSLGDLVLPLVRSGDFGSYRRAITKMMENPVSGSAYRDMIRNIGAATENVVHDRMTKAFGVDNTKFTSGFFTATLLTNWTDMMRDVSAAVAFEHFKAQQKLALDFPGTKAGRLAKRQLEAYGLKRFYEDSTLNIDYIMETNGSAKPHDEYYTLSAAVHRFANQTIFTPNQNDQPLWAQTPTGQIIFQLKSFPLMMTRLGRDVFQKARKNPDGDRDLRPLLYFAGAAPAFGAVTTGTKDIIQSRGGEENRQMQLRDRAMSSKSELFAELGMTQRQDIIAGWYLDGLLTMGGLGLIGQLFYDSASQIDNGDYGAWRIMELFAGPSMGIARDAIAVGAGAMEYGYDALGGETTNAKERQMWREITGRIPIGGQITGVKEYFVDKIAGEREG